MALPQAKPHMPPGAYLGNALNDQILHHEHRLGTAVAAGLQNGQRFNPPDGQQLRGNGAVHVQGGAGNVVPIKARGQGADLFAELRDVLPGDGEARRQLVSAVALQQGGQGA